MMRAVRSFLSSAAASAALLVSGYANADTQVAIAYVTNSLAEAFVANGPWTLHSSLGRNRHDASGVLPAISNPPFGTPYANYCVGGRVQTAQGFNLMQPYYFPFVRPNRGWIQGFFDYRPRNEQESVVTAISTDLGASWVFKDQALG